MIGARAWAAAQRVALFHQGTGSLGLPAGALSTIGKALGPLALQPPQNVDQLVESLTTAAIAIAVEALSAVPVVGSIASAIGSMALMLRALSKKKQEEVREILPPAEQYNRNDEEYVMNAQLLPALTTGDWTRLFVPRVGNDLRLLELDTGWMLASHDGGEGLGFIPGSQQINSVTQAFWHKKSSRTGSSLAVHQDIGDFYPGPAQLMTAVDQQVQRPGPALWSVVPSEVLAAWKDHLAATLTFAYEMWQGRGIKGTGIDKLNTEQRHIIVQQLVAPLHVTALNGEYVRGVLSANSWSPKNPPTNIIGAFIEPWCERLADRQEHYLGTTAVAYADPTSAAFQRVAGLGDKLAQMRKLLLGSPARYEVDQRDVPDAAYRTALFEATIGSQYKAPGSGGPSGPSSIDPDCRPQPRPPAPPRGGPPFSYVPPATTRLDVSALPGRRPGGGAGLALAVGLVGLWGATRWKRRRR
ncbi:MAG: hypothetical protein K0V04_09405 [Deltaproteobacteria bacterium]|nr:hypothetical protein [Deltaproteobacteria bacterium]